MITYLQPIKEYRSKISLGIEETLIKIKIYNLTKNGNIFSSTELINECRYPFRTPNPADTVTTIINELKDTENSIDSAQVNSEVDELRLLRDFEELKMLDLV